MNARRMDRQLPMAARLAFVLLSITPDQHIMRADSDERRRSRRRYLGDQRNVTGA
jgi:hypothetical protein